MIMAEYIDKELVLQLCEWYEHEYTECDYAFQNFHGELLHMSTEVFSELKRSDDSLFFETADQVALLINVLSEKRVQLGLTRKQVAEKTGLKQSAIARMERLQSIPRLDTVVRVAQALGVSLMVAQPSGAKMDEDEMDEDEGEWKWLN